MKRETTKLTIAPAEVKAWFGRSQSARMDDWVYVAIADRLNKFRRPDDPAPPSKPPGIVPATIDVANEQYWDFDAAIKAVNVLQQSLPAMIKHWDGLRWAPETSGGYMTIKALSTALEKARPYIESPFGGPKPRKGRKKPKDWHLPAILIAQIIIRAMTEAECRSPAITRNSVVARVVLKALERMSFTKALNKEAVSMHLVRWDKKYGLAVGIPS